MLTNLATSSREFETSDGRIWKFRIACQEFPRFLADEAHGMNSTVYPYSIIRQLKSIALLLLFVHPLLVSFRVENHRCEVGQQISMLPPQLC